MRVEPAGEALPQTISEPTQWSPELGLGTAASNVTDVVDALTLGALLDLIPTSTYVGVNGSETPVCAEVGDTILELDGQRVDHDAFNAGLAAARRAKRTVRLLIARGA